MVLTLPRIARRHPDVACVPSLNDVVQSVHLRIKVSRGEEIESFTYGLFNRSVVIKPMT